MEFLMSIIAYAVDRFLDQIPITHFPSELHTRVIVTGVAAAAQRGVFLGFAAFDDFMKINSQNLAS
jgi:hypothetical protein